MEGNPWVRPELGTEQTPQIAALMLQNQTAFSQRGGVVRQSADGKPGEQTEDAVQQSYQSSGGKSPPRLRGNGELGYEPVGSWLRVGQNAVEEMLELLGEEAIEKEVRHDQIVAAGGLPHQGIGVM